MKRRRRHRTRDRVGGRVGLPAAALDAGDGVGGTAVRVAVDDLLSD